MRPRRALAVILLASAVAGCRATVLTPSPSDALRQQVQELEGRVAAQEAQIEELRAQLAARGSDAPGSPSPELLAATPRVARISIGGLSRVLEPSASSTRDAAPAQLLVFLNVEDGKGRPTQLTGELSLAASLQGEAGALAPLASAHWGPLQVAGLFRGGFGSPHYALQTPVQGSPGRSDATALVVVTYTDGWTGRTLKATRAVPWPVPEESAENSGKNE
jgi:outer membrane murein-binding lipoprotein Lpp